MSTDKAPRGERGDNRDDRGPKGRNHGRGRDFRGRDDRGSRNGRGDRRRDEREPRGDRDRRGGGRDPRGRDDRRGGGGDRRGGRDDRRGGRPPHKGPDRRKQASGGPGHRGRKDERVKNEAQLSRTAQERLRALRKDYEPGDEERRDTDRDTYNDVPGGIRLQKALAGAGVASRRASEEMIAEGRVSVDGETVRRFGARVDPEKSEIRVDGMRVVTAPDKLYFALNKPRGVVSTMWDPQGRPTLGDFAGQTSERIFHVGRLDTETEGLILLTNDGDLANRLTHPRYKVVKTYVAKVPGPVPRHVERRARQGVELDDGPVEVDSFRVVDDAEPKAMVEIRLHEGRKHIVRRLMEELGHPVSDLARTQVGPVGLNALKPGTMRALTAQEVSELYQSADL
ncbi:pseudouridine synthase [Nocardiopsis kunsanensis]|uniref:Pseudouridine synthase n=1 Tax=Nocardiopsis kunsanensis TaxID=141693 RepID=A0A919CEK3_9ACTN|nr:pseudouridine synthase [Nocardiopsis kunsanensis]GHD15631.1 pseudouridine synthase [Nocardiopsis kunsanensis]